MPLLVIRYWAVVAILFFCVQSFAQDVVVPKVSGNTNKTVPQIPKLSPGQGVLAPKGGVTSPQLPQGMTQQQLMQMLQQQGGLPGMQGGKQSLKAMLGSDEVEPIYDPIHIPSHMRWVYLGIAVIVGVAILWFIIWLCRRPKAVIIRKPYEIAFEKLSRIKELMSKESARQFSTEVSDVIRSYIEERFLIVSTRATTDEFMDAIRNEDHAQLKLHMELLHDFLEFCDLAKFAGCDLSKDQMGGMMDSAWRFVEETKEEVPVSSVESEDISETVETEVVTKGGVS